MKLCIFGAGAVGSMIGGELARVGRDVTLIARGAHLEAIRRDGLTVRMNGEERRTRPACTDDPRAAGIQDVVIFVVKAHQAADAAEQAAALIGPETVVVAAQNGIPWWYFHDPGSAWNGHLLSAVDADRRCWNAIGPERVLGGVINGSCAIAAPGIVDHTQRTRALTIGEPAGEPDSARCGAVAAAFADTDIDLVVAPDIRWTIWSKLLSNVGTSMVCVLTRSPLGRINSDPACRAIAEALMRETASVAGALGVDIAAEAEKRATGGGQTTSTHKPSTLQDLEAGKAMEIDDIVGAVAEIARLVGRPTPTIDMVYALLRRTAEEAGCYPGDGRFMPGL